MTDGERKAEAYRDAHGDVRVKVDAPGIAAVSAKIDPAVFIYEIAKVAGLTVKLG
jgi:hypothetical protein